MKKIEQLQDIINDSDNIVFFGGAGVSTESGLADFRSKDGLYSQSCKYPPETILSHHFFMTHTEEFYSFYREKMLCPGAQPNNAHLKLAELERAGKIKAVITQNIDGLHQKAGSKNVFELHGSVRRNSCLQCSKQFDSLYIQKSEGIPNCVCGGIIKPDVVLYEEALDQEVTQSAASYISRADVLIVGGTSLLVYPAAGLIEFFKGRKLILINKSPTAYDERADLVINGSIGEIMGMLRVPLTHKK